jgi:hypothetical protein
MPRGLCPYPLRFGGELRLRLLDGQLDGGGVRGGQLVRHGDGRRVDGRHARDVAPREVNALLLQLRVRVAVGRQPDGVAPVLDERQRLVAHLGVGAPRQRQLAHRKQHLLLGDELVEAAAAVLHARLQRLREQPAAA